MELGLVDVVLPLRQFARVIAVRQADRVVVAPGSQELEKGIHGR